MPHKLQSVLKIFKFGVFKYTREKRIMITFEEVRNSPVIKTYIEKADESLVALGYTEHSFAHVTKVALQAGSILRKMGYSEREAELAQIAGYLHDIGNVINRID